MVNGSFYLVTDDASTLPPLEYIASSSEYRDDPPQEHEWVVLNKTNAVDTLGPFGGRYVLVPLWQALSDRRPAQGVRHHMAGTGPCRSTRPVYALVSFAYAQRPRGSNTIRPWHKRLAVKRAGPASIGLPQRPDLLKPAHPACPWR